MLVEKGDFFVNTRGMEFNMDGFSLMGLEIKRADTKPRYDRSLNDIVFKAEDVAGDVVCARLIYVPPDKLSEWRKPGMCRIINLTEVEAMTVTPEFVAPLTLQQADSQKEARTP